MEQSTMPSHDNPHLHGISSIVGPHEEYITYLRRQIAKYTQELGRKLIRNTYTDSRTDSDRATAQVAIWIFECLTQHPDCLKAESAVSELPSRVIDLGSSSDSENLRLIETHGRRGRYTTLSHRWQDFEAAKTTEENFQERLECFNLASLTKTMRDAVGITRNLGIRYLWIDAVCIIQGSHSDWSSTACDMARIYRNAVVTIAASSSTAHSDGCFTKRQQTPDSIPNPLDSRGWILQEQLLSLRTLKYHAGWIEWECISKNDVEPGTEAPQSAVVLSESQRIRKALWGFRSTSMSLRAQAHHSWHRIVESYSRRHLTQKTDKLAAIQGIASFLGEQMLGDRLEAGLWPLHLWRELLWRTDVSPSLDRFPALPPRLTELRLPSWSWASVDGPITYSGTQHSRIVPTEPIIRMLSVNVEQDDSRTNVQGRLKIKTKTRRLYHRPGHEFGHLQLFHEPRAGAILAMDSNSAAESEIACRNIQPHPVDVLMHHQWIDHICASVILMWFSQEFACRSVGHFDAPRMTVIHPLVFTLSLFVYHSVRSWAVKHTDNERQTEETMLTALGSTLLAVSYFFPGLFPGIVLVLDYFSIPVPLLPFLLPSVLCLWMCSYLYEACKLVRAPRTGVSSNRFPFEDTLRNGTQTPIPADEWEEFRPDTDEGGNFDEIWVCQVAENTREYYCLALVPVGGHWNTDEFRRIGMCVVSKERYRGSGRPGFFENCVDEIIVLV